MAVGYSSADCSLSSKWFVMFHCLGFIMQGTLKCNNREAISVVLLFCGTPVIDHERYVYPCMCAHNRICTPVANVLWEYRQLPWENRLVVSHHQQWVRLQLLVDVCVMGNELLLEDSLPKHWSM